MEITQLDRIEKILLAQMKSSRHLHWIGGYAHGRTSNDDPFLILYPASAHLNFQVCRVYSQDFKKLPAYVNTAVSPTAPDTIRDRAHAEALGVYVACPMFAIVTHDGKEVQTGSGFEKRFSDVIYISKSPATEQSQTRGTPPPRPQHTPQPQAQAQAQAQDEAPWGGDDLFA